MNERGGLANGSLSYYSVLFAPRVYTPRTPLQFVGVQSFIILPLAELSVGTTKCRLGNFILQVVLAIHVQHNLAVSHSLNH